MGGCVCRPCVAVAAVSQIPEAVPDGDGKSFPEIEGPGDSVSCCHMVMGCVIARGTCLAHGPRRQP